MARSSLYEETCIKPLKWRPAVIPAKVGIEMSHGYLLHADNDNHGGGLVYQIVDHIEAAVDFGCIDSALVSANLEHAFQLDCHS